MDRKDLLNKLNIAKNCLATQDTIPVLMDFCFDKNKITTFNTGQAVVINFESGLSCCVPGDQLTKLISSYGTEKISIAQTDSDISVKSGRSSVKLKTLPVSDFPFKLSEELLTTTNIHVLTEEFFVGIKECALSMGNNAGARNQYGVTVISTPKKTTLYSSDRARISSFTLAKPLESGSFSFILPKPFCDILVSASREFKSGKLFVGKESIMIEFLIDGKSAGVLLYSKFNDDIDLIPFDSLLSQVKLSDDKFQPVPESLINCIDRNLILISADKNPEIDIRTDGKTMIITSANAQGDVDDEIEFSKELDEIQCKMKPLFVRQAISASEKIAFADFNGEPILVGIKDNLLHLVSSIKK